MTAGGSTGIPTPIEPIEQDRIWEQVDLDPWLSRQERLLTRAPDDNYILRVYIDDPRQIPFGHIRNVGCQIVYHPNYLTSLSTVPPKYRDAGFTCEQRGLKER